VNDDEAQAIRTDLSVAVQFHLPYLTCDWNTTSIIITTVPQVSLKAIIGLLFIKATGMIIDTVDNVVKAKHLVCELFPIEFCCTTKNVPAIANDCAAIFYVKFSIIKKTNTYIPELCASIKKSVSAKWVHVTEPHMPMGFVSNSDGMTTVLTNRSMIGHWFPPPSANDTPNEYHDQILGEYGYL
jgi:hypothetical protein